MFFHEDWDYYFIPNFCILKVKKKFIYEGESDGIICVYVAVQHCAVQCSLVHYISVHCNVIQCSTVQCRTAIAV